MPVKHINSAAEYSSALKEADSKLVVVDFYADWCGPCKRISPFLEELSEKLKNVVFLKVNVDEVEEVAQSEGITAMPTFFLYKNQKKIGDLVGASQDKLKELIEKNA